MSRKTLLWLWLFFLGLPSPTWAQSHRLSATIPELAGRQVKVSQYTGLETEEIRFLDVDGQGSLQGEVLFNQGMYLLECDDWKLEFLSVKRPVQFVMHDCHDLRSIQFIDSPENETWANYLIERQQYRQNVEALKTVLRQYDPSSDFYQTAKNEYFKLHEAYFKVTDSLISLRNDYASRLIRTDREAAVDPSLPVQEQRLWLLEHYLDEVDFNELSLIPTNVLTTKLLDYLSVTQGLQGITDPELAFVVGLDRIFEKAKVNLSMYGFVLEYMLQGFSALGMSKVTDYLLNYPQLAEGEITQEEALALESRIQKYQKVKVGAKAPDIDGTTVDGKTYHLYDSEARQVVVFFWAVDCEYCHDFLVNLRKKLDLEKEFELVTVALADSREEVVEELESLKLKDKGFHLFDEARWDGKAFLDYHVTSTPTVFLLDQDKTIVCKPYDWNEIRIFLKNNK